MLKVTRWFIKAGMVYLMLAFALILAESVPGFNQGIPLLPVYWHMIVVGWITQIIMGVSIWMFPRKSRGKRPENPVLPMIAFWLLNTGLILRFIAEPFLALFEETTAMRVIIVVSVILQVAAIVCYMAEIWPRIRPRKTKRKIAHA